MLTRGTNCKPRFASDLSLFSGAGGAKKVKEHPIKYKQCKTLNAVPLLLPPSPPPPSPSVSVEHTHSRRAVLLVLLLPPATVLCTYIVNLKYIKVNELRWLINAYASQSMCAVAGHNPSVICRNHLFQRPVLTSIDCYTVIVLA